MDAAQTEYEGLGPGSHTLLGIPGGGKTNTLLRRVARLVREGHLTDFLLLTYSKDAAAELIRVGADVSPGLFTRENTRTMHALSRQLVTHMDSIPEFVKTNVSTYVWAMHDALKTEEGRAQARETWGGVQAMFVDEAQDLNALQYETLTSLADAIGTSWIEMVGDPDQNIYASMQKSSSTYLLAHADLRGGTSVRLTSNFRSTNQIVAFANRMRPSAVAPEDVMVPALATEGPEPEIVTGLPEANCHAAVARIQALIDEGTPKEDIAVLGMVRFAESRIVPGLIQNAGLTLMANLLHDANIPFVVHFSEFGNNDETGDRDSAHKVAGHVSLLTTYTSKGLAWPHVLSMNFNLYPKGFVQDSDGDDEAAGVDRLCYVAVTRARKTLTLFVNTGPMSKKADWAPPRLMPGVPQPVAQPVAQQTRPRDDKVSSDMGVRDFICKLMQLNNGQFEYELLRRLTDAGGLTVTLIPHETKPRPKLPDSDHNDSALLGTAAEFLAVRAAMGHDEFVDTFLIPPAKKKHMKSPSLRVIMNYQRHVLAVASEDPVKAVWRHVLYEHQLKSETRYRMQNPGHGRNTANLGILRKLLPSLEAQGRAFTSVIGHPLFHQKDLSRVIPHTDNRMYTGRADIIYISTMDGCPIVCELKLTQDTFNFRNVLQLLLYAHADGIRSDARLLLWNLHHDTVNEVLHDWNVMEDWLIDVVQTKMYRKKN